MERIWSMTDLAYALGVTRQMVWDRAKRGLLGFEPDYETGAGISYWSESHARQIIDGWVDDLRGGAH